MKLFKRTEEQQADRELAAATTRVAKAGKPADYRSMPNWTRQKPNSSVTSSRMILSLTRQSLPATTNVGALEDQRAAIQAALEVVKQDRDHAKTRLKAIQEQCERNIAAQRHDELADAIMARAAAFAEEGERFAKTLVDVRHLQAESSTPRRACIRCTGLEHRQ